MSVQGFMKKIALLSLCLPSTMMVTILTSSVIYIYQEYSYLEESLVTMILTIPNLTILLGLVIAPVLLKKISIKPLLVSGMLIYTICGVAPVWCGNFYLLLFFRALLGIGCGIVIPLQSTLIATYPEQERAVLMGFSTLLGCGVSAVLVAVSGMIAALNWRYVFFMYLINVIVLILMIIFVPNRLESDLVTTHSKVADKTKEIVQDDGQKSMQFSDCWNVLAFYYAVLIGSYMLVSILVVEMAMYLQNTGMGGSAETGLIMGVYTVGTAIAGLILERYINLLKEFALPMIFLLSSIGFLLLWKANSLAPIGIAALLVGMTSCLIACVVDYKLSCELPLAMYTTASAGVNFFVFIMNFIAPMLFAAILGVIPGGSYRTIFMIYAVLQAIMFVIVLLLSKYLLRRT